MKVLLHHDKIHKSIPRIQEGSLSLVCIDGRIIGITVISIKTKIYGFLHRKILIQVNDICAHLPGWEKSSLM